MRLLTVGLTALAVILVRVYQIDTLQTDIYGDIQIVHDYVTRVRAGAWPFFFNLSAGPLYHYLIAPVTSITGMSYTGLKLASVLVSLAALLATYALSARLVDRSFALLAAAIAGVSSWLLIFSRLGNSQIVVPLLSASALWLCVRAGGVGADEPACQTSQTRDLVACAVVSTLGLYAYPPAFVLPAVSFVVLAWLWWTGKVLRRRDLLLFVLTTLTCALPWMWLFLQNPAAFTTGYIGGKIVAEGEPLAVLLQNLKNALLAFHVRGDAGFRSNPIFAPHLDPVSGVLLLAGIAFWLQASRRRLAPVLLVPFALLQLPSVLVLSAPREVPSAARTLGAAPIAYILVASGLYWVARVITHRSRVAGRTIAGILLASIVLLNLEHYFRDYIGGLPYHDTSIGKEIASYADVLPAGTTAYVVGCCWEGDMPELQFVKLAATHPETLDALDPGELTCERLQTLRRPAVLIWSHRTGVPSPAIEGCRELGRPRLVHSARGLPVFHAARVGGQ